MENKDSANQTTPPGPTLKIDKASQDYIEAELGMVKFLDYLVEEPFDFIFQQKIYNMYTERYFTEFFKEKTLNSEVVVRKEALYTEFTNYRIEQATKIAKEKAEEISLQNGVKNSFSKRYNKINYILMGGLMAFFVLSMFLFSSYSYYILIPVLVLYCIVPNLIRKKMNKKWKNFKYEHAEEFKSSMGDAVQNIRTFNQLVLDDCRDYMLSIKLPLQAIQFTLYSNDYRNVEQIREIIQNEQIQYLVEFQYPAGMKPLPIPGRVLQSGSIAPNQYSTPTQNTAPTQSVPKISQSAATAEDNENDLFIIFQNVEYNPNGTVKIQNLKYIKGQEKETIEMLLDHSSFEKVHDPQSLIPNFRNNSEIKCGCGSYVELEEIQKASSTSYPEFSFYLGIGKKCIECGDNPFLLFAKSGTSIPMVYKDIFAPF